MRAGVLASHLEQTLGEDERLVRRTDLVDVPLSVVHLQLDALDVEVRGLVANRLGGRILVGCIHFSAAQNVLVVESRRGNQQERRDLRQVDGWELTLPRFVGLVKREAARSEVGVGVNVLADALHAALAVRAALVPVGIRNVGGHRSQKRLGLPDVKPVRLFERPRVRKPEVLELQLGGALLELDADAGGVHGGSYSRVVLQRGR